MAVRCVRSAEAKIIRPPDRLVPVRITGGGHEFIAEIEHGLAGQSLQQAAKAVIDNLSAIGGSGGLVAVDRSGGLTLPFNTAGMYRGYVRDDGAIHTAIYHEPYQTGSR